VKEVIKQVILDSIKIKELINIELVEEIAKIIIDSLKNNGKLLICGNGGSAAQAQHFSAELIGRFEKERKSLPAISLTTDTSNLTAIGNDYGFDKIFSRQVEALGSSNDVLFCLSTSGNSENIIQAINVASNKSIKIITLLGKDGGKITQLPGSHIIINAQNTARIQETHILIIHILCKLIEDELC